MIPSCGAARTPFGGPPPARIRPPEYARDSLRDARAILRERLRTLNGMARDTRDRLLDIGLDQFARHGLAATTISDIESQAGLRRGSGSFYRHFSSKEELFIAVVERELERLQRAFEERAIGDAATGDARTLVAIECRRVLTALVQREKLLAIVIRDRPAIGSLIDRFHKIVSAGRDVNSDMLATLMDTGAIPRRDPRILSVVLTNALVAYQGSTQYLGGPSGDVSPDDYIATVVDLVFTGGSAGGHAGPG
jgi:AcrR family transcriptional regulator